MDMAHHLQDCYEYYELQAIVNGKGYFNQWVPESTDTHLIEFGIIEDRLDHGAFYWFSTHDPNIC